MSRTGSPGTRRCVSSGWRAGTSRSPAARASCAAPACPVRPPRLAAPTQGSARLSGNPFLYRPGSTRARPLMRAPGGNNQGGTDGHRGCPSAFPHPAPSLHTCHAARPPRASCLPELCRGWRAGEVLYIGEPFRPAPAPRHRRHGRQYHLPRAPRSGPGRDVPRVGRAQGRPRGHPSPPAHDAASAPSGHARDKQLGHHRVGTREPLAGCAEPAHPAPAHGRRFRTG